MFTVLAIETGMFRRNAASVFFSDSLLLSPSSSRFSLLSFSLYRNNSITTSRACGINVSFPSRRDYRLDLYFEDPRRVLSALHIIATPSSLLRSPHCRLCGRAIGMKSVVERYFDIVLTYPISHCKYAEWQNFEISEE